MANQREVYKCELCGNIVEVLHAGGGTLVCCGKDMKLMEEKTADSATEKHVPIVEKFDGGFKVIVGSTAHPMTDDHYIEWVQLLVGDGRSQRLYLKPGDKAEAAFLCGGETAKARSYCNKHELWKS